MSLEKCNTCNKEFLTEADPYTIIPGKDGLCCGCIHESMATKINMETITKYQSIIGTLNVALEYALDHYLTESTAAEVLAFYNGYEGSPNYLDEIKFIKSIIKQKQEVEKDGN